MLRTFSRFLRSFASKKTPIMKNKSRAMLVVEQLPDRICPSLTLTTTPLPGHYVAVSGHFTSANNAFVNVSLGGALTAYLTTDANGDYSDTVYGGAMPGTVNADAIDPITMVTSYASASISVTSPTLSMSIANSTASTITLSGDVTGIDKANNSSVQFSGAASGSATTDANGHYSVTVSASMGGTIYGQVMDTWMNTGS